MSPRIGIGEFFSSRYRVGGLIVSEPVFRNENSAATCTVMFFYLTRDGRIRFWHQRTFDTWPMDDFADDRFQS